jgi:NTP pyrophosphatase (non-canonical NTP hydrolase)
MTPGERERLVMLIEECGEVIQAASKCLRHGYESTHPKGGETNRQYVTREYEDLLSVVWAMRQAGDIPMVDTWPDETWECKLKYTHHQGEPK